MAAAAVILTDAWRDHPDFDRLHGALGALAAIAQADDTGEALVLFLAEHGPAMPDDLSDRRYHGEGEHGPA